MDSVKKLKDRFERRKTATNDEPVRPRRVSATIKDKVSMYQKKADDAEKIRTGRNLFDISKKYGFNKFLKSEGGGGNTNTMDNVKSLMKMGENMELFMRDIEIEMENYEKEIEVLNNLNSNHKSEIEAIKMSYEKELEKLREDDNTSRKICENCEVLTFALKEKQQKINDYDINTKKIENEMMKLEEFVDKIKKENEEMEAILKEKEMEIDALNYNINSINQSNQSNQSNQANIEKEDKPCINCEALNDKITQNNILNDEKDDQINSLKSEIKNLNEKSRDDCASLTNSINENNILLDQKESEINALLVENNKLSQPCKECKSNKESLEQHKYSLEQITNEFEIIKVEYKKQTDEYYKYKEQYYENKPCLECNKLSNTITENKELLDEKQNEINLMKTDIKSLEENNEQLTLALNQNKENKENKEVNEVKEIKIQSPVQRHKCEDCGKLSEILKENKKILDKKETEVSHLIKENELTQKKYDEFNNHINTMMNSLTEVCENNYQSLGNFHLDCFPDNYGTNNINNINNTNNINKISNSDPKINPEFISNYIFQDFLLANSLNIRGINKRLISNHFLSYLTTAFSTDKNTNLYLSIYHEYLQDVIIQIYISFRKFKKRVNNNSHEWLMSEEDINEEIIEDSKERIFELYHNLNVRVNSVNPSIEDYFDSAVEKLGIICNGECKLEAKKHFIENYEVYKKNTKDEIAKIIRLCKTFIHAGKLFHRSEILYDFWKLFHDVSTIESENKYLNNIGTNSNNMIANNSHNNTDNRIYYYQTAEAPDFSDYLIHYLKFHSSKIDTVFIHGARIALHEEDGFILKLPLSITLSTIVITGDFLQKIKSLTITNARMTDESLYSLNKLIEFSFSLHTLDLSNNLIGDKGTRIVSQALKMNKSIAVLHIGYNNITSNGTFYLSEMLLKNSSIRKLFLAGNNIKDAGLQSLINILTNNNKSITHLDLSNNELSPYDLAVISALLTKNFDNLNTLNLSLNKFNIESVNIICNSLKINTSLKVLYLNNICLDEEVTPYFIQYIVEMNVEELYLDDNCFGDVGGVQFANVVRCNLKLKVVSLKMASLSSGSLICIAHALDRDIKKKQLKLIQLEDNNFDSDSVDNLVSIYAEHFKGGTIKYMPKISMTSDDLHPVDVNKLSQFDNFILV